MWALHQAKDQSLVKRRCRLVLLGRELVQQLKHTGGGYQPYRPDAFSHILLEHMLDRVVILVVLLDVRRERQPDFREQRQRRNPDLWSVLRVCIRKANAFLNQRAQQVPLQKVFGILLCQKRPYIIHRTKVFDQTWIKPFHASKVCP